MRYTGWLGCACLTGCGEPLIALVGVVPADAAPASDAAGLSDAADAQLDAAAPLMFDAAGLDDNVLTGCVVLPDVAQAYVLGTLRSSDIVATHIPSASCPLVGDAGAELLAVAFSRIDGAPILRAQRRYALAWPPPGRGTTLANLERSELTGGSFPCAAGEPLGPLLRPLGSRGCIELSPALDAQLLTLTAQVVGLDTQFQLCEGACPRP